MNYNFKNNLFNDGDFSNNNPPLLISKKIDTYFNDLIRNPEPIQTAGIKNDSTLYKFYNEYIEHNILLLFIILCLGIFLFIKYINKNYKDNDNLYNTHYKKNISNNNFQINDSDTTDTTDTTDTDDI